MHNFCVMTQRDRGWQAEQFPRGNWCSLSSGSVQSVCVCVCACVCVSACLAVLLSD